MEEPELKVTEKFDASTTIESMTALEPEIFRVYPPTEIMVSVVRVTSLAANTATGKEHKRIVANMNFPIQHYLQDVADKVNVVAPGATYAYTAVPPASYNSKQEPLFCPAFPTVSVEVVLAALAVT